MGFRTSRSSCEEPEAANGVGVDTPVAILLAGGPASSTEGLFLMPAAILAWRREGRIRVDCIKFYKN